MINIYNNKYLQSPSYKNLKNKFEENNFLILSISKYGYSDDKYSLIIKSRDKLINDNKDLFFEVYDEEEKINKKISFIKNWFYDNKRVYDDIDIYNTSMNIFNPLKLLELKEKEYLIAYVLKHEPINKKENCTIDVLCPYCYNIHSHGTEIISLKDKNVIGTRSAGHGKSYCIIYDKQYLNNKYKSNDTDKFINMVCSLLINKNTILSIEVLQIIYHRNKNNLRCTNKHLSLLRMKQNEKIKFIDNNIVELTYKKPNTIYLKTD